MMRVLISIILIFLVAVMCGAASFKETGKNAPSTSIPSSMQKRLISTSTTDPSSMREIRLKTSAWLARGEITADKWQLKSFVNDFIGTTSLSADSLNIKSWELFSVAVALTVTSLASFNYIMGLITDASMAAGFTADPAKLLILDLRNGYTAMEVSECFQLGVPTADNFTSPSKPSI
jgi:hypothetical protein